VSGTTGLGFLGCSPGQLLTVFGLFFITGFKFIVLLLIKGLKIKEEVQAFG